MYRWGRKRKEHVKVSANVSCMGDPPKMYKCLHTSKTVLVSAEVTSKTVDNISVSRLILLSTRVTIDRLWRACVSVYDPLGDHSLKRMVRMEAILRWKGEAWHGITCDEWFSFFSSTTQESVEELLALERSVQVSASYILHMLYALSCQIIRHQCTMLGWFAKRQWKENMLNVICLI